MALVALVFHLDDAAAFGLGERLLDAAGEGSVGVVRLVGDGEDVLGVDGDGELAFAEGEEPAEDEFGPAEVEGAVREGEREALVVRLGAGLEERCAEVGTAEVAPVSASAKMISEDRKSPSFTKANRLPDGSQARLPTRSSSRVRTVVSGKTVRMSPPSDRISATSKLQLTIRVRSAFSSVSCRRMAISSPRGDQKGLPAGTLAIFRYPVPSAFAI